MITVCRAYQEKIMLLPTVTQLSDKLTLILYAFAACFMVG